MSSNIVISASFKLGICGVCRNSGTNQYLNINSNLIEYEGIYFSLGEILIEALDFQVIQANSSLFFC